MINLKFSLEHSIAVNEWSLLSSAFNVSECDDHTALIDHLLKTHYNMGCLECCQVKSEPGTSWSSAKMADQEDKAATTLSASLPPHANKSTIEQ